MLNIINTEFKKKVLWLVLAMIVIAIIFAVLYIFLGNRKEDVNINNSDKKEVINKTPLEKLNLLRETIEQDKTETEKAEEERRLKVLRDKIEFKEDLLEDEKAQKRLEKLQESINNQ